MDLSGSEIGADLRFLSLGLKRNELKIDYFGAEHYGVSIPPPGTPITPPVHAHYIKPYKVGETNKSWYFADKSKFYKKKLTVKVTKAANAESNKGYPIFGKWLGIQWPDIKAVACAGYYNKTKSTINHGRPSFVLKEAPWKKEEIKENIDAYQDSRKGGWYAHLVPVGYGVQH